MTMVELLDIFSPPECGQYQVLTDYCIRETKLWVINWIVFSTLLFLIIYLLNKNFKKVNG